MPIQLPNLDDRTYDDLVAEGLHLIPTYAPEWTNYNPSDPGITLIELFAYITELLIYRLDRVTDENKAMFLKLIDAPEFQSEPTLDGKIRKTIEAIRTTDRAITCQDFERLAMNAHPHIARAHCIPKINLLSDNSTERPGYLSVIIVPTKDVFKDMSDLEKQVKKRQLIDVVSDYLDERRLITTRIIVVEPIELKIKVETKLVLKSDAIDIIVKKEASIKLKDFFDPLKGGQTGTGWEFGRSIYISEIYELLDKLSGVDYVESVVIVKQVDGNTNGIRSTSMEIALKPNQLVAFQFETDYRDITI
jgi:Baseplate J-like protein